jgi:hypothetical protein
MPPFRFGTWRAADDLPNCNLADYEKEKQSCVETFTRPNITRKMTADIKWQNRRLLKKFTENAIESTPVAELRPLTSFIFLNMSTGIYKRLCPNFFVPHNFISNIEFLFRELHYITTATSGRTEIIPKKESERTTAILANCLNETVIQNFTANDCDEQVRLCKYR